MARRFASFTLAIAALLVTLVPVRSIRAADELTVASPDGKVVISFALKSNPQPYLPGVRAYYRVSYGGVPVLTDSPLGLDFAGAPRGIMTLRLPARTAIPATNRGRTHSGRCATSPIITISSAFRCAKSRPPAARWT